MSCLAVRSAGIRGHEPRFSVTFRASAVKEHSACALLQARSLLAHTARSKNGAFELRLGLNIDTPAVRHHDMFSLIEVYLASECFQVLSWFILKNNALIGDRELNVQ
jgi:hypothetical protein